MIERIRPRSLNAKLVWMMIFGICAALAVFVAVNAVGGLIVDNYYMSPDSVSARKAEIYSSFSLYVNEYGIEGRDSSQIDAWDEYGDYVNIFVYTDKSARTAERSQISSVQQYNGLYGKLYPLNFSDGLYHIAIHDNTVAREDMLNNISAILAASLTFILIMLVYFQRLTNRLIKLSGEVVEIGKGKLESEISAEGSDELSMLAAEVDNMRNSVIEHMGNERRAWQANNELITAISHDIRTPMTTLIGYLGLLNDGDFSDSEKNRQFASAAYDKAMDLKDLTDELFKYFLVFGKAEPELNMEEFDGALLVEQLLGEAEFELSDMGFSVRRISSELSCTVSADPMYLKRVVDNMVSNIKKYADKERSVVMLTELKDGNLSVCISNTVGRSMNRVESTKIGLRTCNKIMECMKGSFSTNTDQDHFAAEFSLPVA